MLLSVPKEFVGKHCGELLQALQHAFQIGLGFEIL
jgi:hypothetical protein